MHATTNAISRDTRSASTTTTTATIPSRNLNIRLVFTDLNNAISFQREMEAANVIMPNTVTRQLEPIPLSSMMARVSFFDYKANASDSPAQSLAESMGCGSVTSGLTQLPLDDPLSEYQSIENHSQLVGLYRMHLVAKKKSTNTKKVSDLGDNLLAGTWLMHQLFDGMRTYTGLPLLAIDACQEQPDEEKMVGIHTRRRVDLEVQFFNAKTNAEIQVLLKNGSSRIEGKNFAWKTWVWVEDAKTFMKNLKLKSDETKKKWKELDDM